MKFIIPFLLSPICLFSQGFLWATQTSSPGDSGNHGASQSSGGLTSDKLGNVFLAGNYVDEMTIGDKKLPNRGGMDIFLAKYNEDGVLLWAISEGGAGGESIANIAADSIGNVVVVGKSESTSISFGSINFTYNDNHIHPFIVKYDSSGKVLWAKSNDYSQDGRFFVDVDFDVEGNVYVLGIQNNQNSRFFVTKYTASGDKIMSVASNEGQISSSSIHVDSKANIFITGKFFGSFQYGPFSFNDTSTDSNQGGDSFVMKLRSDGSAEWASHISGKHSEYPSSITSDRNGNVYATGYFLDTINFDNIQLVGDTIPDINGQLSGSLFLVKYNLTGNPEWAKANEIKNTKDKFLTADIASDISIDQNDNAVIVGFITNELKLDETSLISCDENGDAFIAAFNPSGKVIGIAKVGGITNTNGLGEVGRYICTDKMGNYYIAGDFTSPTAYLGQLILNSTGLENIFLGKLGELPWVYGAFSISADSEINCKEPLTVDLSASFSCSAFPSRLDKKSAPTIIELTSEDKTMVPLPLKIGESMDDQIVCTLPDSLITGVYLIRANWKGSIASKEVEINVNCRPFIPNVFTPDHDGKNDKFRAQISKSGIADMEIYDRWGTMIYRGDAKTGWDGESYPSGVYFYLIKFGSKKYKGWLSLIRG